jgi:hypothetical protein
MPPRNARWAFRLPPLLQPLEGMVQRLPVVPYAHTLLARTPTGRALASPDRAGVRASSVRTEEPWPEVHEPGGRPYQPRGGRCAQVRLLAERVPYNQQSLADRNESVRIAKVRYKTGASHLLTVLIIQTAQLQSQRDLITLRNAQLANRIDLHLALGGDVEPGGPDEERSGSS